MHQPKLDESEKRHWVSIFLEHDLSAAAFCREFGLPYASFLAWKRLYPEGGAPPSQAFVELVAEDVEGAVPAPATGAERPIPVAELAFTGGLTLRIFAPVVPQSA
jgi:hypothetical protein